MSIRYFPYSVEESIKSNVLGNEGCYFEPFSSQSLARTMVSLIKCGKTTININPLEHEWKYRTSEFNKWVKRLF